MKVNKKLAAEMVGIGRTTFYRHIKEKPISVDDRGKIDVSELIRVYGNENVRTPEQLEQEKKEPKEHDGTPTNIRLEEEIKRLKSELEKSDLERSRERAQFTEEIESLRENLNKALSQSDNLTKLLTDQRNQEDKQKSQKEREQEGKLDALLKSVQKMEDEQNRKKGFMERLFGS